MLVAAAALVPLAGCGVGTSPVASSTEPSRHTGPREVVSAYLAALDAGDASAALQLATPRFQAELKGEVDSPLTNWVSVADVRVGTPREDDALASARRYRLVLNVPVNFALRQREEVSMRDGKTTWGYVVVRQDPSDAWLIDDQGVG